MSFGKTLNLNASASGRIPRETVWSIPNRARNSARIRESILAMTLVASRYENQLLSLNYVINTTVTQNFDSYKSKRNSTPAKSSACSQIHSFTREGELCLNPKLRMFRVPLLHLLPQIACFVLYLKIINIFMKSNDMHIIWEIVQGTKE